MFSASKKFVMVSAVILVAMQVQGCGGPSSGIGCYKKSVASGIKVLKWAAQMEEWYGEENVDHFITHWGFDKTKPRTWNSVAYLNGRYILTLQVPVTVDYKNCTVADVAGDPQFYFLEVDTIEVLPNGSISTRPVNRGEEGWPYSENEWRLLEKVDGDISALPLEINKSNPHPLFKKLRDGRGRDQVKP